MCEQTGHHRQKQPMSSVSVALTAQMLGVACPCSTACPASIPPAAAKNMRETLTTPGVLATPARR
jgi:hypothetical protein